MTKVYDVGKTTINHPFGNDLYTLFMVMTGGWFMALFYPHYSSMQLSYAGAVSDVSQAGESSFLNAIFGFDGIFRCNIYQRCRSNVMK